MGTTKVLPKADGLALVFSYWESNLVLRQRVVVAFLLFMIFIDLAGQPHRFDEGMDYGGCDLKQVKQYLLSFLQISP